MGDLAIITGCASVFAAFAAGIEYKHAEKEYERSQNR